MTRRADPTRNASGVYVTLDALIALQYKARGFSFLPRQPIHSLLSGRHASRMRGRGLDFEELRGYLPGDDPRTIDWKVTARTGEPHVRIFTEERERPALLVVDQRIAMFFGSRRALKSCVAAEVSALGAWRIVDQGDRAGALVFDDERETEIRPHRSRRAVMQILETLVEYNTALSAERPGDGRPGRLNEVLERVARIATHDYLVAIVSDFDGADADTRSLVTRLARHNDVLAVLVTDPMSRDLPSEGRYVVSDGELQVELELDRGVERRDVLALAGDRMAGVLAWQRELGVPVMPLSTAQDPLDQVRHLLGSGPRRSAR